MSEESPKRLFASCPYPRTSNGPQEAGRGREGAVLGVF